MQGRESIPGGENPWNKGTERLASSWSLAREKEKYCTANYEVGPRWQEEPLAHSSG